MRGTAFSFLSALALAWCGTASANSKGAGWTLSGGTLTICKDYAWGENNEAWLTDNGAGEIREVVIEEGVAAIGAYAFSGYENLISVTIPASVTTIGAGAFSGCGITSIELPEALEDIGDGAFARTKLTSISLPANVTTVGSSAFMGCTSLASITSLATEPPSVSEQAAGGRSITVFVPATAKDAYEASDWAGGNTQIRAIGATEIKSTRASGRISVEAMTIYVDGKPAKEVYTMTGKKASASKPLGKGIYLVRTPYGNKKVVVK